jgi:hypothetical protein
MDLSFVVPVRKGGLGNQMFQVAAAMVYAKETNRRILLPNEFYNAHRTPTLDYADTLFREFIYRIQKSLDGAAIQQMLANGFTQHPGEPGFDLWSPIDCSGNVLLHGYFQSYPPLEPHEETIRSTYLHGLGNLRLDVHDSPRRIGLHVRRGDYLQPPASDVLPVQPLSYYEAALKKFDLSSCEVYILSDEISWCKEQVLFQSLPHKTFVEEPNEVKTLALMTTCLGGFICANSTFSWWGAFLGAYKVRAPIVVPKDWFKGGVGSLFPTEWTVL